MPIVGIYEKPGRVSENLSWVHPGFGTTFASHEPQRSSEVGDATV